MKLSFLVEESIAYVGRAVFLRKQLVALALEYRTGKLTDRKFVKRALALVEPPRPVGRPK